MPTKHTVNVLPSDMFPYLLVSVGSGVSIIKVEGATKFTRVDGSALGGGSFVGLGSLLAGDAATSFDELLELAKQGNSRNSDLTVGDIYGREVPGSLGLDPDLCASSFGKAARHAQAHEAGTGDHAPSSLADRIKSLLHMICYEVSSLVAFFGRLSP